MGTIIVGILMIIGGASGEFVLKGTGSSGALVGLGVVLVVFGLFKVGSKRPSTKISQKVFEEFKKEIRSMREEGKSDDEIKTLLTQSGLDEEIVNSLILAK